MAESRHPRLILFPSTPDAAPLERSRWQGVLREAGFIGDALTAMGPGHFRAGPEFLSCITFLGCSPALDLGFDEAGGDELPNQYFVELPAAAEEPVMIGHPARPPRCPHCRAELADWSALPPTSVLAEQACPECARTTALYRWQWRRHAGFGRYWIDVRGVHEGEAVPTDAFLSRLQSLTGALWDYAYSRI
jgi:hypothetical protein